MEERNALEKDADAQLSWAETKQRAQGDFNPVVQDHIRMQRQLNAEFWTNEILHEHLEGPTKREIEKQPDLETPER